MKEIVEEYKEIASRTPPGDRWTVIGVDIVQNSLTEALESYFMVADVKPKSFILDLEKGKIFIIVTSEQEVKIPESKKFNIYGE
jgi:DNA topoisomerase VI subunit B